MGLTDLPVMPKQVTSPRPKITLVEEPLACNIKEWEQFYEARGAKTPRDRRRAQRVVTEAFRNLRIDDSSIIRLLGKLATAVHSPFSLKVAKAIEDSGAKPCFLNNIPAIDVSSYTDASAYFWDNQVAKLLSKFPFSVDEAEVEARAVQSFLDSEAQNRLTNEKWRAFTADSPEIPEIEAVAAQLGLILGDAPSLEEICHSVVWGPGTNVGYAFPSGWTGAELKFLGPLTCYPHLIPIASQAIDLISESWSTRLSELWGRHKRLEIVETNKLFTVFKRWDTKRTAMMEASLNSLLQRGLGVIMRDRFDQFTGRSLRMQPFLNQEYARIGSLCDSFCTLDLTAASDSVCRSPVASVTPGDWYHWMEGFSAREYALPVPQTAAPDTPPVIGKFEMLSSMGNGFTFEFESILFYSIVTSIVPWIWTRDTKGKLRRVWPHVHVFGDDIIFPSAYYERVLRVLTLFGLNVNKAKSFNKGPFRESCGADWFCGHNVRPLYLTRRPDEGSSIVGLANRLAAFAHDYPLSRGCIHGLGDQRFEQFHQGVVSFIPKWLRRLQVTPPNVPHGLWGVWGDSTWETPEGQPKNYLLVGTTPIKIDLRYTSGWFTDSTWPIRLCGWNLLYARLAQLSSDPGYSFAEIVAQSGGEESTQRRKVTYKVITSSCHEDSRWGPFANLAY